MPRKTNKRKKAPSMFKSNPQGRPAHLGDGVRERLLKDLLSKGTRETKY